MKLALSDLRELRGSLFASLLLIAIGATSVVAALDRQAAAEREQRAAAAESAAFEQKLQRVSDEEKEIKLKASLFGELQTRGIIGEERRLDWVELLKDIRDELQLIDLHYEISPQRPLDGSEPAASGGKADAAAGFRFYASSMQLRLQLLHEEDQIRLLEALQQRAQALIQLKHCSLSRLPRNSAERTASAAQLQAECQIDWITVRTAGTP